MPQEATVDFFSATTNFRNALTSKQVADQNIKASKVETARNKVALKSETRREESGYNEELEKYQIDVAKNEALRASINSELLKDDKYRELYKNSQFAGMMAQIAASKGALSAENQNFIFSETAKADALGTEQAYREAAIAIAENEDALGIDPFTDEERENLEKGDIKGVMTALKGYQAWSTASLAHLQEIDKIKTKAIAEAEADALYDTDANDKDYKTYSLLNEDDSVSGSFARTVETDTGQVWEHTSDGGLTWSPGIPQGTRPGNVETPQRTGSLGNGTYVNGLKTRLGKLNDVNTGLTEILNAKSMARTDILYRARNKLSDITNVANNMFSGNTQVMATLESLKNDETSELSEANAMNAAYMLVLWNYVSSKAAGTKSPFSKSAMDELKGILNINELFKDPSKTRAIMKQFQRNINVERSSVAGQLRYEGVEVDGLLELGGELSMPSTFNQGSISGSGEVGTKTNPVSSSKVMQNPELYEDGTWMRLSDGRVVQK